MPQAAPAPRRTFHNTALRSVLLASVALSLVVLWVSHRAIASHATKEDTKQLLSVPLPPPRREAAKGGLPPIPDFEKAKTAEASYEEEDADKETNGAAVGGGGAQSFHAKPNRTQFDRDNELKNAIRKRTNKMLRRWKSIL